MINNFALFFSALSCSALLTFPLVWLLRFFHANQSIRREGPTAHQAKAGTPTMGGLGFIITILALSLIFLDFDFDPRYLALIILFAGFALLGLADDLLKILRQQNLGLTFWQKIIMQTLFAGGFTAFLVQSGQAASLTGWLRDFGFASPVIYFPFSIFVIVGAANATNLTDGLNGLLASTSGLAFLAFAWLARQLGLVDATSFALIAAGSVLAFLFFNFPQAKVFMGDTGSLALGAALAGLALIMHQELRLVIIGGVFVLEALSVILQVTIYKLFKKRIFKMAPLHHHFELVGIKEQYVVIGFWLVALILALIGALL